MKKTNQDNSNKDDGSQNKKEFIITHLFDAPREFVFKAWTDPKHIMQWWGPKGFTAPHIRIDLRPNGHYHYCMRSSDGKEYWSGGIFKEIDAPKRIVCTDYFADEKGKMIDPVDYGMSPDFPKESEVIITFEEHDNKTRLTIHYSPKTAAEYDAMMKSQMDIGWKQSLDRLAEVVGKGLERTIRLDDFDMFQEGVKER
jgi:uncharacterized protein YndB with AHSA1/START domain